MQNVKNYYNISLKSHGKFWIFIFFMKWNQTWSFSGRKNTKIKKRLLPNLRSCARFAEVRELVWNLADWPQNFQTFLGFCLCFWAICKGNFGCSNTCFEKLQKIMKFQFCIFTELKNEYANKKKVARYENEISNANNFSHCNNISKILLLDPKVVENLIPIFKYKAALFPWKFQDWKP